MKRQNKMVARNNRIALERSLNEILDDYNNFNINRKIQPLDAFYIYRLLLGRNPGEQELVNICNLKLTLSEFLDSVVTSKEFSQSTRFMPAGHEFLAEREDFKFYFNTSDREMGAKMAIGAYESETVSLFREMMKPGMVCIDAGAQTGFYTLIMARIAGSEGKVYSFEPNPDAYNLLEKNIIANELSNCVTAYNLGLSDTNEEIVASEVSNMYIAGKINGANEKRMKVVRCDDVINSKVDFIKIDIEGSEPKAIEGMSNLINTYHPIIVSEINEYWLKDRAHISSQRYLDQLKSFGYDVFDVKNYCNGPANPLTSIKQDVLGNMDVICIYNHKTV